MLKTLLRKFSISLSYFVNKNFKLNKKKYNLTEKYVSNKILKFYKKKHQNY